MTRISVSGVLCGFLLCSVLPVGGSEPQQHDRVETILRRALAEAYEVPRQAEALVALAWPAEGDDPELQAAALQRLIEFGHNAVPALRKAIARVAVEDQEQVVEALIRARWRTNGQPPEYLAALQDAIWLGSRGARRLAMPESARFRDPASVLPTIDAAIEDPALLPVAIEALRIHHNDRARFFLAEKLTEGDPETAPLAAGALASIGGRALGPLREAVADPRPETRRAAIEALLPVATTEDLSILYAYYGDFPDDPQETRRRVRETAARLEQLLEQQRRSDSASPLPEG